MKKIVCENYLEMSKKGAEIILNQLSEKPDSVFGLATGSTPVGMYECLCSSGADFSKSCSYNLDEYYPILKSNDQSYCYFMKKNLFDGVKFKSNDIPNGETDDIDKECARYDKAIENAGGIDLQVLGLGPNGHIGFNEPDSSLSVNTHSVVLTKETIEANSRFFDSIDDVPKKALTLGMGAIMKAKKILVLANGKAKAKIVKEMFSGYVTTSIPATLLQLHPDVTVIVDKEADGE